MNQESNCHSPDSAMGVGCRDDHRRSDFSAGLRVWCCSNHGGNCHRKVHATISIVPKLGNCSAAICTTGWKKKATFPTWCAGEKCSVSECCSPDHKYPKEVR